MADMNGITPVMNVGGADGFGGNSFMYLFGLLILLGLFNGGGFGGFGNNAAMALGYENLATSNEVQRGFDNQNLQAQTRDILSAVTGGTAQAVAATNQAKYDNINVMKDVQMALAGQIADVKGMEQNILGNQNECCCSTKMLIQEKSANTDALIAANKYETAMQMAQMEARLTAKMDQNEITALRDQVQQLQLAQATNGVLRFPNSWSYGAGPFPPIYGGCCGQGNI